MREHARSLPLLVKFALILAAVVAVPPLCRRIRLAMSIVIKLRANRLEPVVITTGATVMSDTLSLVIFAVCVSTFERGFSSAGLLKQLVEIAIFIPVILLGVGRLGAWLLKKMEKDEEAYFILMLMILAVSAFLADSINLPGIVGAFLAGLATNEAVHQHPAKEKLEFIGNTLFVPSFFLVTGFLIDPPLFIHTITDNLPLTLAVISALVVGKLLAAETVGLMFHYSAVARSTMWALTLPQVAATLAATLVAYKTFDPANHRLLDDKMLNVVLVLVLVTSTLGPVLTSFLRPALFQKLEQSMKKVPSYVIRRDDLCGTARFVSFQPLCNRKRVTPHLTDRPFPVLFRFRGRGI